MGLKGQGLLGGCVAVALFLATANVAGAALPQFATHSIAINQSVGGVKLGERKSHLMIWGHVSCHYTTAERGSCDWSGPYIGGSLSDAVHVHWLNATPDAATSKFVIDTIRLISTAPARSRLRTVRTNRGIGIDSTLKAARAAYPRATYVRSSRELRLPAPPVTTHLFFDTRGVLTAIYLDASKRYPPPKRGVFGIPDEAQTALLKFAGEKLAGFAFNQVGLNKLLGDSTGDQLNALKDQLNRISAQVSTLQDSVNQISSDLTKIALEGFTVPLGQTVSKIESLYNDFYAPATRALTTYIGKDLETRNAGSSCSATPACVDARAYFERLRDDFAKQFTYGSAASLNTDLHDALMPGVAGSSVMSAYGQYLLKGPASTGFLTSADSDRVLGFQTYFAEFEAVAALMKAQWNGLRFQANPDEFTRFLDDQVRGFHKAEQDALPVRIPPDAVISLPADAALRTTTRGMRMWMSNVQAGPATRWDPSSPGAPHSVDGALKNLNTTAAGEGYKDWVVPSRSDLTALFAGRFAAFPTDAYHFLGKIAPKSSPGWYPLTDLTSTPYLWASDPAGVPSTAASPEVKCVNHFSPIARTVKILTGYAHTALGPTTASLNGFPTGYTLTNIPTSLHVLGVDVNVDDRGGDQPVIDACKRILAQKVTDGFTAGAGAVLLASRSTGDVNYLP